MANTTSQFSPQITGQELNKHPGLKGLLADHRDLERWSLSGLLIALDVRVARRVDALKRLRAQPQHADAYELAAFQEFICQVGQGDHAPYSVGHLDAALATYNAFERRFREMPPCEESLGLAAALGLLDVLLAFRELVARGLIGDPNHEGGSHE